MRREKRRPTASLVSASCDSDDMTFDSSNVATASSSDGGAVFVDQPGLFFDSCDCMYFEFEVGVFRIDFAPSLPSQGERAEERCSTQEEDGVRMERGCGEIGRW